MTPRRARALVAGTALVLALALAACGDDPSDEGVPAGGATTAAAAATTAAGGEGATTTAASDTTAAAGHVSRGHLSRRLDDRCEHHDDGGDSEW